MTETAEAPTLTWGREQTQAWTQAVMALASMLRQRRMERGRLAWSDSEDAARRHDRIQRAAEPTVRSMNKQERDLFERQRAGQEPSSSLDTRQVDGPKGSVTVTVSALGEDGGWGLSAYGRSPDGEQTHEAYVRCVDETAAKRLADELLASSPDKIERLAGFADLAAARAATAASEVRESEAQRLARTSATVRQVWPRELAERVINPSEAQRARGDRWNPAFGALAWRLHEMEERGYAIADVLRRIDPARLMDAEVRNPAALAEYFIEEMMPDLRVINLDADEHVSAAAQPQAAGATAGRPDGAAATRARDQRAGDPAQEEQVVGPHLADALSAEVLVKVREAPGYDRLRHNLFEQHQQGRAIAPLLSGLATNKIVDADNPASYLGAIVQRRIQNDQLHRGGPDRIELGDLIARGLPRAAADKVVGCPAWPGLAKRLDAWQKEGVPITEMLEALPADRLMAARKPAAYTAALLNAKVQAYRRSDRGGDSPGLAPRQSELGTQIETPEAPARMATGDAEALEAGRRGLGARGAQDEPTVSEPNGPTDSELSWTDDLDPTSSIDRVGLEATVGLGSPARDARLDARLRDGTAEAAGHAGAADAASGRAEEHERDAAYQRSTPDLPETELREDLDGQAHARGEDNLAAGERAIAAAERGAEAAAATRAEVTYTPAENSAKGDPRTRRPSKSARPVPRRQTPDQGRGRSR